MYREVAAAISKAKIKPEDAGTVALAKRYAALIDEATPRSAYAEHIRKIKVALSPLDDDAEKALTKIADALAAHSVASDLGPKLLAALTALGLTPAARGAKGGAGDVPRASGPLDRIKQQREERQRRRGVS
jgi:hypothetical protein